MSKSSHQIKIGAIVSYFALGINILAALFYMPWMVSMIGKSNYALYTLATSFISLFMLDVGASSAISRFAAKYLAEGKQSEIDDLVSTVVRLYMIVDAIIFIVLFVLYFFVGQIFTGLTDDEIIVFKQLYIIVMLYSVISFPFLPLNGILNAYELFIQQKFTELFQKILSVGLTIVVLLNGGDVRSLVVVNAASGIIAIVFKVIFVKRHSSISIYKHGINKKIFYDVARYSFWVIVITLAQRCIFNIAPSILGIVSNSTEIAIFAPASALEGYFYSVSAAVNGLFLATVSRYIANNEEEKIFELMVRVGRYQFFLLGMIIVEFFCIGHEFMLSWMGEEFVNAYPCALILFVPDFLIFSQQIANTTVVAKNKVKQQAFGYIIMSVCCLGLSFPLSKMFGALGACIAIAVAYIVLFIYMNILYYRHLNINVFSFYKQCYLKLALPVLIVAVLGFLLCKNVILLSGWVGIIIKAISVAILYVLVMIFFTNDDEKKMLKRFLRIK